MKVARTLSQARADRQARLRSYHGACACGSVRFVVTMQPTSGARCICGRCQGMGLRVAYAARADFRLLTGQGDLTEPLSDARTPHHFFCARCGEPAFGYPQGPEGAQVSVNVALLDRGDPDLVAGGAS